MTGRRGRDPSALGPLGKVAAWLGLWTPPKGVVVPPVPWRKIVAGTVAAAAILVPVGILVGGAVDSSKQAGARAERRRLAASNAAERHRLAADQRPHSARAPGRGHGAAMVAYLERAITADARTRVRRRQLAGPILSTICEHAEIDSEARLAAQFSRYRCTVLTRVNRSVRGFPFASGYTFFGTIHFKQRTLVWCKANPRPGEQASRASVAVKLSASCAGPLRDIM